jgi:CHAD domain-containing protein
MAYRLHGDESVAVGIRRIVHEQVDRALDQLIDGFERDRDEAIHDSRKRFKKIRGILRLVRDQLGSNCYRYENNFFRDLGRKFSHVRDARVRVETLESVRDSFDELATHELLNDVREALEAYHASTWEYLLSTDDAIPTTITALKEAHERVEQWPLSSDDSWSTVESGLKRVYKRGDRGLNHVLQSPNAEDYHDWRKRVKYLWYHLSILRPIWPGPIDEWVEQTHRLSRFLGDEHDLTVLREFMLSQPKRFEDLSGLGAVTVLIERRREEVRSHSLTLGQRIYVEPPHAFVHRMGAYWDLWRHEYAMAA